MAKGASQLRQSQFGLQRRRDCARNYFPASSEPSSRRAATALCIQINYLAWNFSSVIGPSNRVVPIIQTYPPVPSPARVLPKPRARTRFITLTGGKPAKSSVAGTSAPALSIEHLMDLLLYPSVRRRPPSPKPTVACSVPRGCDQTPGGRRRSPALRLSSETTNIYMR